MPNKLDELLAFSLLAGLIIGCIAGAALENCRMRSQAQKRGYAQYVLEDNRAVWKWKCDIEKKEKE